MRHKPPTHYWSTDDRDSWIMRGPSRRLRKLYAAMADVERRMEEVRHRPDEWGHAPTHCVYMMQDLRPLYAERHALWQRIEQLQNHEEPPSEVRRRRH